MEDNQRVIKKTSVNSLCDQPVMMAFPFGVMSTAWQVIFGAESLRSSLPVSVCHTLTSL